MQEHFSGSSTLSYWAYRSDVAALFPTDMRYGWDLRRKEHQEIINTFYKAFRVLVKFFSPECTPWSQASTTADPKQKAMARILDKP